MELATLSLDGGDVRLRRAELTDVPAIVALIADDRLRAGEESTAEGDLAGYQRAFRAIDADPAHLLVVMDDPAGRVIGTMQLTYLPGMARAGATRMQIEAVRISADRRGDGAGTAMIRWAVEEAHRRGATLVQLTSDASRTDAHRFYVRLGFEPSHTGFKLFL